MLALSAAFGGRSAAAMTPRPGARRGRRDRHGDRVRLRAPLRRRRHRMSRRCGSTCPNGVSFARSALFGVLNAQLYFGLWALAFVYPFAVESAASARSRRSSSAAEAELARLRAHLEPHFLLNTLNAIAGPRHRGSARGAPPPRLPGRSPARRGAGHERAAALDEQIAWLRRYAQILEARHHGVLRFRWDIAPDCEAKLLPRLLLQPLVENAVKHGALRRGDGAGEVVVRAPPRRRTARSSAWSRTTAPGCPTPTSARAPSACRRCAGGSSSRRRAASLRFESSSEGHASHRRAARRRRA